MGEEVEWRKLVGPVNRYRGRTEDSWTFGVGDCGQEDRRVSRACVQACLGPNVWGLIRWIIEFVRFFFSKNYEFDFTIGLF